MTASWLTKDEWVRRYMNRLQESTGTLPLERQHQIISVAYDDNVEDFPNNPEGAAEETLDVWSADGKGARGELG